MYIKKFKQNINKIFNKIPTDISDFKNSLDETNGGSSQIRRESPFKKGF